MGPIANIGNRTSDRGKSIKYRTLTQETSGDPDRSRSWHQYAGTHYLQYDWRYTL